MKEQLALTTWKNKAISLAYKARLHGLAAYRLARACISPTAELRRLERIETGRAGAGERAVLECAGKWFALSERLGRRPSCLVRSLIVAALLRHEGHPARIAFGARKEGEGMGGHCWVCVGDRVVYGEAKGYQELVDG